MAGACVLENEILRQNTLAGTAPNMPNLPNAQKKNCVRRTSAAGRDTVLFRYIKCLTNR